MTPQELDEQISCAAAALVEALFRSDLIPFYAALRTTELPFLCAQPEMKGLVGACAAILYRLGGISPAAGLAVENHLCVTCALAIFARREGRRSGKDELMSQFLTFQLTWHQTLLSALYLGAAARAIEEGRLFLRSVQGPTQKPLAELDGMLADMGRLAIRYCSARSLSNAAAAAIDASIGKMLDPVAPAEAFDQACAKHAGCRCAEEVVTQIRHIIGARSFLGDHLLECLSHEAVFGPPGGEVDASIERRIGRRVLSETSFLDLGW